MLRIVYYSNRCFEDHAVPLANELARHVNLLLVMSFAQNVKGSIQPNASEPFIGPHVQKRLLHRQGRFRSPRQVVYDCLVISWILRFHPHIVLMEGIDSPYFILLYPLFRLLRIHLVFALHDVDPHSGSESHVIEMLTRAAIASADKVMVFSSNQRDALARRYRKDAVVVHLPYKSYFETYYAQHDIQREDNTILFFGTIRRNKGLEVLIQAAEIARNTIPALKVIIAGQCLDFAVYESFIKTPGMYELHIDRIPDKDVGRFFLRSQFLVLPYHDATQSGPLLISLGFNCPVIASNVGGLAEYLSRGETGILFERDDHNQLAKIIVNLLCDRRKLLKMQGASRDWVVENYSPSRVARNMVATLSGLHGEGKANQ